MKNRCTIVEAPKQAHSPLYIHVLTPPLAEAVVDDGVHYPSHLSLVYTQLESCLPFNKV